MTYDEMRQLQPGDIVRGKGSSQSYVVTANYGSRVTAVRTVDLTNPSEWDLVTPLDIRSRWPDDRNT
jgi:hypothetical protein